MRTGIYKAMGVGVLICLLIIIFGIGIALFIKSPDTHPDKWLKAEVKVTAFFERITLPIKIERLSWLEADKELPLPVYGVRLREVQDTWQAPRPDGRSHEGQDIFAKRGTPVFSVTKGYVTRIGVGDLGGNYVNVVGPGGHRYYYAHLDRVADGLRIGQYVTIDTVLGFVGNTGNAENTPPHLHFGVYVMHKAINPHSLLINRD